jgi:hypothetical protein
MEGSGIRGVGRGGHRRRHHRDPLAIGRKAPITVDNLFTFTKVNLVKQYDALRYINVAVRVQTILEG